METSRFCRACGSQVNETCEIENNPSKPELPLLVKRYIPEFDIKVDNACLCHDCVTTLYSFHYFKRKCLRTEEDLRLHMRKHPEVKTVNLNEIFGSEEPKTNTTNNIELSSKTTELSQTTVSFCYRNVENHSTDNENLSEKPHKYNCLRCKYTTITKANLNRHVSVVHNNTGNREFAQNKVLSTTKSRSAKKLKLSEPARHQCEKCSRTFRYKDKYYYYKHLDYHKNADAGLYVCKMCNFVYKSAAALTYHNKIHVSDQKPFQCKFCARGFLSEFVFTQHLHTHTT